MLIIYNAQLYTQDETQPTAQAIAIDRGRVIETGSTDAILAKFHSARRIDAEGNCVIPGLTDAHIHLEEYAFAIQKIDCETLTRQECLQRLAAQAAKTNPGEWIFGHGWNQNNWTEGYGTASLLDEIAPHNPVYLTHKSLHSSWANTSALQLAGITRNTNDPPGGRVSHLPNGEPDGILFESAVELLEKALPQPSLVQLITALRNALPLLQQIGLTGAHDFGSARSFAALQVLHANNELTMRVIKSIPAENLSRASEIGLHSGFGDDTLRIGGVKLFADGALGPHTAAMFQAYDDDPGNLGVLMMDTQELFEWGQLAVDNGISLAVHAIGDLANHTVLDAFARLREHERTLPTLSANKLRHRIEHVQVLHPGDLSRFSALDIIASMQPIHATSDMLMADSCWGTRSEYAYAWKSLLSQKAKLTFGSDAPVESPNPFWGIHAAVTRQRADGSPSPDGWYPKQRLSVAEAINGFTTGAAYAACEEDRLGKLSPGYLADLLILDHDPYTCPLPTLREIKPLATMVGGEWVFSVL